jgi:tRNA 2-thiocytidine biosynthesis protein TtcA
MTTLQQQAYEGNKLAKRLRRQVGEAIADFDMIHEADKVMVCMSGGKDSYALLDILLSLKRHAPVHFDIVAVNLDQKHPGYPAAILPDYLTSLNVSFRIIEQDTYSVVKRVIPEGKTMCSLCSRLRRGALYRVAKEIGATKIALGHHLDDFIETLLLNLFFAGSLKAMPARLVSDNAEHVVVRPLVYVTEAEARTYAKDEALPIISCCCPACGDLSLQRQRIKRLIAQLEVEHPEVKSSMIRALGNVASRHLLDRRLNPLPELRDAALGGAVPLPVLRR